MVHSTNCIIIDDDRSSVDLLTEYINEVPKLKLLEVYFDPLVALSELLHIQESFILFLDIHMPKFSGLQLAEKLKHKAHQIIFTTGDKNKAIQAFDVNARKYLLKPFELPKFVEAVSDVIMLPQSHSAPSYKPAILFLRTGERGKLTKINRDDIIFVQSLSNYVTIATPDQSYIVYMTLTEMADILPEQYGFFRVHKSSIINCYFMDNLAGNTIYLDYKHQILMSNSYKKNFMNFAQRNTLISKRLSDK